MDEKPINDAERPPQTQSSEYGDTLSDVLKDQARRDELRSAPAQKATRARVHPSIPPVLALVSIWLWVFPPSALQPVVPTIPPVQQEAGLRLNMLVQLRKIEQYRLEHGRLPRDLAELGEGVDGIRYSRLTDNVFRLSGETPEITVNYTSTEPPEELLADAVSIVSGNISQTPAGGGAS